MAALRPVGRQLTIGGAMSCSRTSSASGSCGRRHGAIARRARSVRPPRGVTVRCGPV